MLSGGRLVAAAACGRRVSLATGPSLVPRDFHFLVTPGDESWGRATAGGRAGERSHQENRINTITKRFQHNCYTATYATQATKTQNKLGLEERYEAAGVTDATVGDKTTTVSFSNGTASPYPYVWLRENCQCSECFQTDAIARMYLVDDLDVNVRPKTLEAREGGLRVEWPDGHVSDFTASWLSRRAFTPEARERQRKWCMLPKDLWGAELEVPHSRYSTLMHNDEAMLEWLVVLEKVGVTVVEEASTRVGAINEFIERLGVLKPTHYGRDYEIKTEVNPNNLAYTGTRLGLHTDLPYCEYPPGTTWLHCIRQHSGIGGENDLSDGFFCAEELRRRHPHHFQVLLDTPVYFQDQGYAFYDFNKITPKPTFSLDHSGKVCRIHVSSQSRDSVMDLDAEGVIRFYEALKAYNDVLRENNIRVKTKPGDILILDNTRILHGRTPFDPSTSSGFRHLHNAYIDLDDLRSKRRILQEKLGVHVS